MFTLTEVALDCSKNREDVLKIDINGFFRNVAKLKKLIPLS